MDLFWALLDFLFRSSLLGCILVVLLRFIYHEALQNSFVIVAGCFSLAMTVFGVSDAIIYPYMFSPLRHLPSVRIPDLRALLLVADGPRGDLPLNLAKQHPGADVLHVQDSLGLSMLLLLSPEAHRSIFSTNATDFSKPEAQNNYVTGLVGRGLIVVEGNEHKRQRRLLNPSFRIQNIRSMYRLIDEKTRLFLNSMQMEMEQVGHIEICNWASRLTMDIIGPTLMSKDFQALAGKDSGLEHAIAETFAPSAGQGLLFGLSFFLPHWIVRSIPIATNRMLTRNHAFIRGVCRQILDEKMRDHAYSGSKTKDMEPTSDILGSIMRAGEFTSEELINTMITFLVAGHETTAASIAWAVHLLTLPENKHYQAKIHSEVANVLASQAGFPETDEHMLSYSQLESMPLVHGIVEETLRLYPVAPSTSRKSVRATTIAGHPVPKNTLIALSMWAMNRNPEHWGPDAEKFVPERWIDVLPGGGKRSNKHGGAESNMCNQTFLHGDRACIGREMARAELRSVVVALFTRFEVERMPGDDDVVVPAGAASISPAGGLRVSLRPRMKSGTEDGEGSFMGSGLRP